MRKVLYAMAAFLALASLGIQVWAFTLPFAMAIPAWGFGYICSLVALGGAYAIHSEGKQNDNMD